MKFSTLQKALGRARRLPPRQTAQVALRRARAALRASAQERAAERLRLGGEAALFLPQLVPGATSLDSAVALLEATTGHLPVPAAKLPARLQDFATRFPQAAHALSTRAQRATEGRFQILGFPEITLGRTPDWQLDFVSGQRWDQACASKRQPIVRAPPGADIKVPWELSRLQHLPAVAHAFHLTRNLRFFDLAVEQLAHWIANNPPGRGVNWVCAMDVALRAVSLSWTFELVRREPQFPRELRARVYGSLFAHGHFIRGHLEDGALAPGNHYVADLLGLVWIGALYPAFRGASAWRQVGQQRLQSQLASQVLPDGGDAESSTSYHRLVAEMLGLAADILEVNRHPAPALRATFRRMAAFTAQVLKPDGTVPQLGDADGGRALRLLDSPPLDHTALVAWAQGRTDHPEAFLLAPSENGLIHAPAQPPAIEVPPATRPLGLEAHAPPPVTRLADSGLTLLRHGGAYLLLAATPVGQHGAGGHGHNDKLSLELFLDGDVITDPGSFTYTRDPNARNHFRATAAHATLQVDELEQNPVTRDLFYLPERAHARAQLEESGARFIWTAEHQGFAPLIHRRRVEVALAARSILLTDEVAGPIGSAHQLAVRFPLAPTVLAHTEGRRFIIRRGTRTVLTIACAATDAQLSIESGAYATNYGAQIPTQVLVATVRCALPRTLQLSLRW